MLKENKGITLIALVITIIVLLILAGVSIAMLTGNNGILTKANTSQSATNNAEAKEKIDMELNAIRADILSGKKMKDETNSVKNGTTWAATMQSNLGTGYTVTYTAGTGIAVTAIPDKAKLTEKGSITEAGVVTTAVVSAQ